VTHDRIKAGIVIKIFGVDPGRILVAGFYVTILAIISCYIIYVTIIVYICGSYAVPPAGFIL
jgi:archaellum biogenesis protein FlaJ (TadC family)